MLLAVTCISGIEPLEELFDATNAEVFAAVRLGDGDELDLKETSLRRGAILLLGKAIQVLVAKRAIVIAEADAHFLQLLRLCIAQLVKLPTRTEVSVDHQAFQATDRVLFVCNRHADLHHRLEFVMVSKLDLKAISS